MTVIDIPKTLEIKNKDFITCLESIEIKVKKFWG